MSVGRNAGFIVTMATAVVLAWPGEPVAANNASGSAEIQEEAEQARRKIEEALGNLIAGLKLMMDSIPQYEAPEILENGDILIRRKRPESADDGTGQDI